MLLIRPGRARLPAGVVYSARQRVARSNPLAWSFIMPVCLTCCDDQPLNDRAQCPACNPPDHAAIAADLAAELPDAKGYYPGIIDATAPRFVDQAERASKADLLALVRKLDPSRVVLDAPDIIRLVVAHETLAARS